MSNTFEQGKDEISKLCRHFDTNREAFHAPGVKEADVRQSLIDPFFGALGWDVRNTAMAAPQYREVVPEETLDVEGHRRAPDYTFRVGQTAKFYVEAKRPGVNIKDDPAPAYQLRRYSWSAKLPLSILTSFKEFAVFDCRSRPAETDKASKARVRYHTSNEYADHWRDIWDVFSREAVWAGSFDQYVAKPGKRGTSTVDTEFLGEIEGWREVLARNIALRNPGISQGDLNFAVQRTIDRIVFLRICEDRGIEPYGTLQSLTNGPSIYRRLGELFHRADERYNSGLFYFNGDRGRAEPPDEMTLGLAIDDKALKDVLRGLYYPESPYEFSVLPAEILGQVYEQFLGKVIRLTSGGQAKVDEKPEVRKAGGVYYTPVYIVDYIVASTVGKLLEGKTPKEASLLRIIDPACGSGSFLLGAYQYLLNWHRDRYVEKGPERLARGRTPALCGGPGRWRLTTAEKKRILLNSIYGVDIDAQAVEVTKLSLLLKVLEGESGEAISTQLRLFRERALPDLGDNIKCGNSLIGADFYVGRQKSLLDEEERTRVNAFDYRGEFPAVFKAGGFDAVIGNPPYVLLQDDFRDDEQLAYYRAKYAGSSFKIDTYHLFVEKGISLLANGGVFSMITPANLLTNNHLSSLRRLMLTAAIIDHILVIDGGVFHGISVDNAIFVVRRSTKAPAAFAMVHAIPGNGGLRITSKAMVSPSRALEDEHVLFTSAGTRRSADFWERIAKDNAPLGSLAFVNFGKQLRDRKKYTADVVEVKNTRAIKPPYRACYTGRNVERYCLSWGNLACLDDEIARCGGCWDASRQNSRNKLVTRQIGRFPAFGLDAHGYQCLNTVFMVNPKTPDISSLFLLAVLNSKLLRAFWLRRFYDQRRTFPKIKGTYLKQIPICRPEGQDGKIHHDRTVEYAETMLALHQQLATAQTPGDKTRIQRQIDATDRQIDHLVYELYGLTDPEIVAVEAEIA